MENLFKNIEYRTANDEAMDFEKKRFKFWLERVPRKIRRLEYDLSFLYRKLLHMNLHKLDNKKLHGRFLVSPEFNEEDEKKMWNQFIESFLHGKERIDSFNSTVKNVKENIYAIMKEKEILISDEKIKLIAIGGSTFYGPRKSNERLSDVDVYILLNENSSIDNFEIFPEIKDSQIISPYHIIGTGINDESRGEKRQIHWLLYPHFPVINKMNNDELNSIIVDILDDTLKREDEINEYINKLRTNFNESRNLEIKENHSY